LRVLSPPTLGSSSVVFSFSDVSISVVMPSQFFLGFIEVVVTEEDEAAELASAK
jgi:hypothetical protein